MLHNQCLYHTVTVFWIVALAFRESPYLPVLAQLHLGPAQYSIPHMKPNIGHQLVSA